MGVSEQVRARPVQIDSSVEPRDHNVTHAGLKADDKLIRGDDYREAGRLDPPARLASSATQAEREQRNQHRGGCPRLPTHH